MVYAQTSLERNKKMKICALIPTYNESNAIGAVVRQVRFHGLDVVVVDDGSSDNTAEIAENVGASVLRFEKNEGKGASLKKGFLHLLDKDYEAILTMDGDGQHSPEDIPKFIEAARNSNAAMVIGNRMSSRKEMPAVRWLTNRFTSFLISIICKQHIPDSQCGFRLIRKCLLQELKPSSDNYEIESEIIIQAHQKGFKIQSIPIRTIYARETSQINPLVDSFRFFRFILKFFISPNSIKNKK